MKCPFLDRERELEALDRIFEGRPGFVVVYGRRRIGKTRLLREWASRRGVRAVYYLAQLTSHGRNLQLMAEAARDQLGEEALTSLRPTRLTELLAIISRLGAEVIVIDEFTYWVRAYEGVLSELQEFIDLHLDKYNTLLIVSGSLVGIMERQVLGGGSPLYARATSRLKLGFLPFRCLKEVVPGWSPVDRVRLYSLIGGIPFYYCLVKGSGSLSEAVRRLILDIDSPLVAERDLLLREHFREPHTYNAVLSAIARGYTTPGKIANVTGLDIGHVNKALHTLLDLGLVKRVTPFHSRKGFYRVRDPILRTWYNLVEPILSLLEIGLASEAERRVYERLDAHTTQTWEELVGEYLERKYGPKGYKLVGPAIRKGEEIDILLLNEKERKAILAEAKWTGATPETIEKIRRLTLRKAAAILPPELEITKIYVAVRQVKGTPPKHTITPKHIEEYLQNDLNS
ncbi:MAG: ATP-binding protein [Desulfurococcales archaeon]|nr:ATP-binding protein [Desulfurococcales archaeon]